MSESFEQWGSVPQSTRGLSETEKQQVSAKKQQIGNLLKHMLAKYEQKDPKALITPEIIKKFATKMGTLTTMAEISLYAQKLDHLYIKIQEARKKGLQLDAEYIDQFLEVSNNPVPGNQLEKTGEGSPIRKLGGY